jgi:GAF domain-containing protein
MEGAAPESGTGTAAMPQESYTDLEEKLARAQRERDEALEREKATTIENTRLFEELQARTRELQEALEYQTATSDVLEVISCTPIDLQPVLAAICETVAKLCETKDAEIFIRDGDRLRLGWVQGPIGTEAENWPISRGLVMGRAVLNRELIQVHDLRAAGEEYPEGYQSSLLVGHRTIIAVPLMRKGEAVGVLTLRRSEVKPFTDRQITLLRTFADQAVIAIENTRLLTELRESLQQQTATADVLKTISRSTFDLQVVLDTLSESAARLCDADHAWVFRRDGDAYRWAASYGHSKEKHEQIKRFMLTLRHLPGRGSVIGRAVLESRPVQIADVLADSEYTQTEPQKLAQFRTLLGVPLLRDGEPIGSIALQRTDVRPFTDKQIELLTTFADQAVIAIENVRLFDEVQARTRELTESLEYRTATSEVLNVISRSPSELQPVLDSIVATAAALCQANYAMIHRFEHGRFRLVAANNVQADYVKWLAQNPAKADRGSIAGRAVIERSTIHIPDVLADPEYTRLESQKRGRHRSLLGVPLLREGVPIGVIALHRTEVRPFTDKQIELVTTFADQAVIAIENVRLFDEVQARTRDLSESLQQQTATAEVLKTISRTAFDLQRVLQTLLENAAHICGAKHGIIFRYDGESCRAAAAYNAPPGTLELWQRHPLRAGRSTTVGRALLESPSPLGRNRRMAATGSRSRSPTRESA